MPSAVDHVTVTARRLTGASVTSNSMTSPSVPPASATDSTGTSSSASLTTLVAWLPALTHAGSVPNPSSTLLSASSSALSAAVNVNTRTVCPLVNVSDPGTPE